MKIAYLTKHNPRDPSSWSGTNYYMFKSLCEQELDITHVGKSLWFWEKKLPKPLQKLTGFLSHKNQEPTDLLELASKSAQLLEAELKTKSYDIIFAPVSSVECSLLKTNLPIIYLSDATSRLLDNYYSNRKQEPEKLCQQREFLENKIIERANALVYSSQWAANSAINDYNADKKKTHVIPFGANIQKVDEVNKILESRPINGEIKLLFLGGDWERKGGEVAFDTVKTLNQIGIKAQLIVCGATPPSKCQTDYVSVKGYLRKSNPKEFRELINLFYSCHFMFVPSRADCTPIVFCEASAYALPVISTLTGGIPDVVTEGENGYLLPLEAKGEDFAQLIVRAFEDKEKYLQLAMSTRKVYENKLNWGQWGKKVKEILDDFT